LHAARMGSPFREDLSDGSEAGAPQDNRSPWQTEHRMD